MTALDEDTESQALPLAPPLPRLAEGIKQSAELGADAPTFATIDDAVAIGRRYGDALVQAELFVRKLKRLERRVPTCWFAHPGIVADILAMAQEWYSPKVGQKATLLAQHDLMGANEMWAAAMTHRMDQHPTNDETKTAVLLKFEMAIAASNRGEAALWEVA